MESTTLEIPREQWSAYLEQIELLQRDRPVRVELVEPELGAQTIAERAPLRAIGVAKKGSIQGAIEVDLGPEGSLDHRIAHPIHLYAVQDASGQLQSLDIEDERHAKTLIRFEEPPLLRQ